jgi:hypothetical protein
VGHQLWEKIMESETKGSVEVMESTLVLRDDGRVDCYSSAGYRVLDLDSLPEETQIKVLGAALLKAHKKTIKLEEKKDALERDIANLERDIANLTANPEGV